MSKQPYLNVAIVQSTIDGTIAWNSNATYAPEMSPSESKRAWNEIMVAISQYNNLVETARPEVIILPELTLAHQYERKIADLAKQVGAIIIGGCDFKYVESTDEVVNQGLISVPRYWPHGSTQNCRGHPDSREPVAHTATERGREWGAIGPQAA